MGMDMSKESRGEQPLLLIVDDLPININALADYLSKEYRVQLATSGEQALALINKQRPDLILLDVVMPGMDGYELCRRLKADPELAEIPVIFLTVKDQQGDLVRAFELGAADFVAKPSDCWSC